ncbi:ABC transporter substrate-binding protein [Vibrio sp. SCSIO 43136]|uniref:siderophore ABC transporter substrate-binding protein n=1 Tax=Vibrio sp. SCSIO 43136 TaxID=2819101 RepID=UPI0033658F7C
MMVLTHNAYAISIEHVKGTTEFSQLPKRVVVLGNGSLDVLDRLGVKPVGASHSLLPNYLEHYRDSTTNVGSLAEPNFEAIFMLRPDLIIAENRMLTLYDELSQVAPTVMFYIDSGNYWQDTQKQWRNLGQLFGKSEMVEAIITETESNLTKIKQHVHGEKLDALMLMNNGSSVAMYNRGSRFSIIFDEFGFAEANSQHIAPIKGNHGNLVSFEYIADAKPQVMFILDREQAIGKSDGKAKQLFSNALVESTPASQKDQIVYINSTAWYITAGGMTSTQIMISDVESALKH